MAADEKVDQDLARAALQKRRLGQRPTREESRALARIEKAREEDLRWRYYRTIPQRHWREFSGRQAKVLREQAARYGLPFGERTVDLPAVVRALHDFLAANARKLAADEPGDPPALEKKREEDWRMARLKRHILEGAHLPRAEVHDALSRLAARIRRCGESLQRQFGPAALKILDDALSDAQLEIDNLYPDSPRAHDGDVDGDT